MRFRCFILVGAFFPLVACALPDAQYDWITPHGEGITIDARLECPSREIGAQIEFTLKNETTGQIDYPSLFVPWSRSKSGASIYLKLVDGTRVESQPSPGADSHDSIVTLPAGASLKGSVSLREVFGSWERHLENGRVFVTWRYRFPYPDSTPNVLTGEGYMVTETVLTACYERGRKRAARES